MPTGENGLRSGGKRRHCATKGKTFSLRARLSGGGGGISWWKMDNVSKKRLSYEGKLFDEQRATRVKYGRGKKQPKQVLE